MTSILLWKLLINFSPQNLPNFTYQKKTWMSACCQSMVLFGWSEIKQAWPFKLIIHFVYYYYLMQEGLRNTVAYDLHQTQSDCECVFLLRRAGDSAGAPQIRVNFASVRKSQQSSLGGDCEYFSTIPTYNKDQKFYTPSFILQEDKTKLHENNAQFLVNHTRKVDEFLEEKDELLVPKPSKTNRFCLICKENYDDYLTHISYPSHNRLLKSSAFYNDILELCNRINPENSHKLNKKITKEKANKKGCKASPKRKQVASQKLNQSLSTGLQSPQLGQLCSPVK